MKAAARISSCPMSCLTPVVTPDAMSCLTPDASTHGLVSECQTWPPALCNVYGVEALKARLYSPAFMGRVLQVALAPVVGSAHGRSRSSDQ